ncbi:MAG TPA: amidohydrolase [Bacilli bacterium]
MGKKLIKNSIFVTMDDAHPIVSGCLAWDDDTITYIGERLPEGQFDEVIDGSHRLFMPGLVNTHGHAAMSLLRGYADDLALKVWLEEKMWPIENKFTDEDVRIGAKLSILEMLKSGTTCFVDMYDHMNEVALAVEQSGIRASLARGMIGFPPEAQTAKLKEATQFAKDWNGKADGRITTMMSPHSPYTCPPDFIRRIVETAQTLNLPVHTHMSETSEEVERNVCDYGKRPVAHLRDLGMFDVPCLVAHAVHLTDEEIGILAEHKVHVSHNPGSNLKLASGVARVMDMMRAGILLSLGTDSAASNNDLDMFGEIQLTALIHKGVSGDPTAVKAYDALKMGTINGARSLWLDRVGMLRAGMKADFIGIDIDQPHFYPRTDFISHLVYSASGRDVADVCIDGKWIVRNREVLTMDEEKIMREFAACFARLTK